MKKYTVYLIFVASLFSLKAYSADNAPVTTIGYITNAALSSTVSLPVTVTNFVDISDYKLTILYPTARLTYISMTPHPSFSSASVNSSTPGKLIITWSGSSGITLPDLTTLMNLTFTYISGTAWLNWYYTSGNVCQYKKYHGGSRTILTDTPKEKFYINGAVSNRSSVVTVAPAVLNVANGPVSVPLKVGKFSTIGAITLYMQYNINVLSYTGCTINGSLLGMDVGTQNFNGNDYIVIAWYGGNATLADSSVIVTLNFTFSNAVANYSLLTWFENGGSCEYGDNNGLVLIDLPTSTYYKNGIVTSGNQYSPHAKLPTITNASPGSTDVKLDVTNFNNVKSFTLSFRYDPAVMTYNSFTQNPSLIGAIAVTNYGIVGGLRKLELAWSGTIQSLADGTLATLNYTYISGTSALAWDTTDATATRFNDASGNAYPDFPKSSFYTDGVVSSHTAPHSIAWYASPPAGAFTVPIKVTNFSNIGSFKLTIDYDPGILSSPGVSLAPGVGGVLTDSLYTGRTVMMWTGTSPTLTDSSNLLILSFNYAGSGTSLLNCITANSWNSWYRESVSSSNLYDTPKTTYYINGLVGPFTADFIADNTIVETNTTINMTNLSTTGTAVNYAWTFTPSTPNFVPLTSASSVNPKIQFPVNGVYSATLTMTKINNSAKSTKTRIDYFYIGTPGLWTGITSTDWNTASNWHNYLVPATSYYVNVTIPTAATFWPLTVGSLTMGTDCENITMIGAAQLTIHGNLTINGGRTLSIPGTGLLRIAGNWSRSNSGVFNYGTGSNVEFYGAIDGSILAPSTESFYNLIENKGIGAHLYILNNVIVNGSLTVE
ncbi:MAG: cohesin domain-containing protein [Bacteroidetes bacterium]|nr:cohesin domain-containing protein [Bacteroidota bacterium]